MGIIRAIWLEMHAIIWLAFMIQPLSFGLWETKNKHQIHLNLYAATIIILRYWTLLIFSHSANKKRKITDETWFACRFNFFSSLNKWLAVYYWRSAEEIIDPINHFILLLIFRVETANIFIFMIIAETQSTRDDENEPFAIPLS